MNPTVDELMGRLRNVTGPELTPPAEPTSWTWIAWPIGLIAATAVTWWFRRRPATHVTATQEALAALTSRPTPEALDAILRRYLRRQHGIRSEPLTTDELAGHVSAEWRTLLELVEQWRYSGIRPDESEWSSLLRRAEVLIQVDCGELAGRRTE